MVKTNLLKYTYKDAKSSIIFPEINTNKGEKWCVLGKSGTGKSTFLHLIAGFLHPTEGKIFLNDKEITSMAEKERDTYCSQQIGFVFQKNIFVPSLSVVENLILAQKLSTGQSSRSHAMTALQTLGLGSDKANKKPEQLSIGEQQRASIARAVINNPSILLADEPTSALDDENAQLVIKLLIDCADQNDSCLLVVTHDHRVRDQFSHHITL